MHKDVLMGIGFFYLQKSLISFPLDIELYALSLRYFSLFRIQMLLESGLIMKWKKKHWPKKTKCQDLSQVSTEYHKINLPDVEGAFFMLGIGLFAGSLVFLMEICCYVILKCMRGILT